MDKTKANINSTPNAPNSANFSENQSQSGLTSTISSTNVFMDPGSSDLDSHPRDIDLSDSNFFSEKSETEEGEKGTTLPAKSKVHLLKKPTLAVHQMRQEGKNIIEGSRLLKVQFQEPDICFEEWDSKHKNPVNISGNSKTSGVIFSMLDNPITFRVKREYKKLMTNLRQKYQENGQFLDFTFENSLIKTCVEFTKKLKQANPQKKVFMRPLFIALFYSLMKEECKENDFLVELRTIMEYVNPDNERKYKTKMVIFYLNQFKSIYARETIKPFQDKFFKHKSILSKRSHSKAHENKSKYLDETNIKKVTKNMVSCSDERKIRQIFRIIDVIFEKLSKNNLEFGRHQKKVKDWAYKIFYFRDTLSQTLLCKKVKNVGLALLFLGLTIVFPHQQTNLTDFLDQVNERDLNVNAKSSTFLFLTLLINRNY
jgi:hypothetical protein